MDKSYQFVIDCRENAVVQSYKDIFTDADDRVKVAKLKTADFVYYVNDIPFMCIERKRLDDFASSICDGRYKTQKLEMINYRNTIEKDTSQVPFLVYLVEGFHTIDITDKFGVTKETVMSAITKTMFRDGFQVVFTTDVNDTVMWLKKMWDNMIKGEFVGTDENESYNEYLGNISRKMLNRNTSKMKEIDNDSDKAKNWWMLSLSGVSGVSVTKAQSIIKVYENVKSLVAAYDKCRSDKERELLLCDIKINNRRLGESVSRNVYEHIYNTSSPSPVPKAPKAPNPPLSKESKAPKSSKQSMRPKEQTEFDVCILDSDSEGW